MTKRTLHLISFFFLIVATTFVQQKEIWKIGESDNSSIGMALAPNEYSRFIEKDFGFEDRFFLVGNSDPNKEWPYVLPGPANGWGGTGNTAGIRSHFLNIFFDIDKKPSTGKWKLTVDVLETDSLSAPLVKIVVNGESWKFKLEKGSSGKDPIGKFEKAKEQLLTIDIPDSSFGMVKLS